MKHIAQHHTESHAVPAHQRSADQVAAVGDNNPSEQGNKPNTEIFTKGRFDSSETLA